MKLRETQRKQVADFQKTKQKIKKTKTKKNNEQAPEDTNLMLLSTITEGKSQQTFFYIDH